ncbi:MAG: SRPBCC family protein [Flavobacteriales bacterium]
MKKILYVLAGLVVLVVLLGIIAPSGYEVTRTVQINREQEIVYDYLRFLQNQRHYSVWAKMDPKQEVYFSGTDGEVGFILGWKSEIDSVGSGEQEIKALQPFSQIKTEVRFKEPFESIGNSEMNIAAIDSSSTQVEWKFYGKSSFPMNTILLFMDMNGMLGKDIEGGLSNLKNVLETH